MHIELVRVASLQVALVICSLVASIYVVPASTGALAYGCCVSFSNTMLLVWRYKQGKYRASLSAEWALRQAYRTVIERYMLVVFLLVVGYKLLELLPLWMLAGFVAGQVGWILGLIKFKAG
ncbi:MAG: ATP synthase subunit I [Candidatus Nitrotoga sp.]